MFPQKFAPIDVKSANYVIFSIEKWIAWLDCAMNIQMTIWSKWLKTT
jgi:predicted transcriptional regulator YdeE